MPIHTVIHMEIHKGLYIYFNGYMQTRKDPSSIHPSIHPSFLHLSIHLWVHGVHYIDAYRVLGFSRIYVQHWRWDVHEDAGVKSGMKTHFFRQVRAHRV